MGDKQVEWTKIHEWYEVTYPSILSGLEVKNGSVKVSHDAWDQIKSHSKGNEFYQHISDMGANKLQIDSVYIDILPLNLVENEKRIPKNVLIYQGMFKSESTCGKCNLPWSVCRPDHAITLGNGFGVFAMCQHCWEDSTLEEIKVYYSLVFKLHQLEYAKIDRECEWTLEQWMQCVEKDYNENHKQP